MDSSRKILLDADVTSHFCKGGKHLLLVQMFSSRLVLLDVVRNELLRAQFLKPCLDTLLNHFNTDQMIVADDPDIAFEYSHLVEEFGPGESACMAYAHKSGDIIASSNLSDIRHYCKENDIEFMTTMDILLIARLEHYLTGQECDEFIKRVKNANSKLPCNSISEYDSICDKLKVERFLKLAK